jgi:hypothetical protein
MLRAAAIVVISFLMLASKTAIACTCMAYPDDIDEAIAMAYAQADAVFIGTVEKTRKKLFRYPPEQQALFIVRTIWKGLDTDRTIVRSNLGEIGCGYEFNKRRSYLVFAHWDSKREILTPSFCDLTRIEAMSGDAIGVLNKIVPAGPAPQAKNR